MLRVAANYQRLTRDAGLRFQTAAKRDAIFFPASLLRCGRRSSCISPPTAFRTTQLTRGTCVNPQQGKSRDRTEELTLRSMVTQQALKQSSTIRQNPE